MSGTVWYLYNKTNGEFGGNSMEPYEDDDWTSTDVPIAPYDYEPKFYFDGTEWTMHANGLQFRWNGTTWTLYEPPPPEPEP